VFDSLGYILMGIYRELLSVLYSNLVEFVIINKSKRYIVSLQTCTSNILQINSKKTYIFITKQLSFILVVSN
jgi:hypothetical protein